VWLLASVRRQSNSVQQYLRAVTNERTNQRLDIVQWTLDSPMQVAISFEARASVELVQKPAKPTEAIASLT